MWHYNYTFRFILQPFGVPSLLSLLTSAITGRSLSDNNDNDVQFNDLFELLAGHNIQSENPIVGLNNRQKRSDTEMSSDIFGETFKNLSDHNETSSLNHLFRLVTTNDLYLI